MLAEWEPQAAILLTWPHRESDWRPLLTQIEQSYLQLAALIVQHEDLWILCHDRRHQAHVERRLAEQSLPADRISLFVVPTDDTWIRDYGPVSVTAADREIHWIDFTFNAWGQDYPYALDDTATARLYSLLEQKPAACTRSRLVFEGGNLESNGAGLLLANEDCLRHNPALRGLTVTAAEQTLKKLLDVERIAWIRNVRLAGDDTNGHIDNLVRFCNPDTLVYTGCKEPGHPNHAPLARLKQQLQALSLCTHRIELPLPPDQYDSEGRLLPASYANFLITNRQVIVPVFNAAQDQVALELLQACFPERRVTAFDCRTLIKQRGGVHCASLQVHAG